MVPPVICLKSSFLSFLLMAFNFHNLGFERSRLENVDLIPQVRLLKISFFEIHSFPSLLEKPSLMTGALKLKLTELQNIKKIFKPLNFVTSS